MLCLRVGKYAWDAWVVRGARSLPKEPKGEREVAATMLQASPCSTSAPYRAPDTPSATWPVVPTLPPTLRVATAIVSADASENFPFPTPPAASSEITFSSGAQEGRTAWARVPAPRRQQGKWGLGDDAGESPVLCTRLGTGPRRLGKQSGGKGTRARKHDHKEQSRAAESHVIAEPSRGPWGGACRRFRSVSESPAPQGRLRYPPGHLDWRHFLGSTCSPAMGTPLLPRRESWAQGEADVRAPRGSTPRCGRRTCGYPRVSQMQYAPLRF